MKGRDVNLNPARIDALHSVLGGGHVLASLGPAGLSAARQHLDQVADLARLTALAARNVSARTDLLVAQTKARQAADGLVADPDAWGREIAVGRALEDGVRVPSIRLVAVTCLVRSAQSWSEYV